MAPFERELQARNGEVDASRIPRQRASSRMRASEAQRMMSERRVLSGLERLASARRDGNDSSVGSLAAPLSDESKRVAQAIRMVANPGRNATPSHDRLLRIVVWSTILLLCGLVWTAVAYLAVGAPPPW
jgi:hypothetical protein